MAKLTVFFNYKETYSKMFGSSIVRIGRDETNDIVIDSDDVAAAHAAIIIRDNDAQIKRLNGASPLIINGKKVNQAMLENSDMISLGKHVIVYNTTADDPAHKNQATTNTTSVFSQDIEHELLVPTANLQIINGANIGKILHLKKAMTRLGHNGSGVIVIAKRKDGYFVSALENKGSITVNSVDLGEHYLKLNHGDILTLNSTAMQFFLVEAIHREISIF